MVSGWKVDCPNNGRTDSRSITAQTNRVTYRNMFPLARIDCRAIVGHCGVTVKLRKVPWRRAYNLGIQPLEWSKCININMLEDPTRSCHVWHRGAIYRFGGQE